ncbi:MAG: NADH-quinone oxidoreductase subunit L [Candidatus Zixiibacteriota bacterium]
MEQYLYLVPALPLAGFLINGLLIGRLPRPLISTVACASVGLSFVVSIMLMFDLVGMAPDMRVVHQSLFTWITSGQLHVDFALLLDPLSAVMILVVTGVGFLIHIYSIGYMSHEKDLGRYFTYLNLFTFSMLVLVLADSFPFMFVGWEGVGLCSYLLIGFWYERKSATDAGKKAFIVNRIGDFGFLLGMFIIFWQVGSLQFATVIEAAPTAFSYGGGLITAACLLLFVGAAGKSAQIPLYVWLPDAMEGPTPVSALIHAATMVTAGVYMIARTNVLFLMAPTALTVVAVVGAVTALFAATIGLAQNDIKRVLAYSTVSQLGYMFLACGVTSFSAGLFHLMTHAFFKALLFLGSGSVIHAMSGMQDMRKMGGLKKYLPVTYWTFLIATLAISGIPGMSGFFSKDEILWKSFSPPNGHVLLWLLGFVTAGLTAFYMFRLVYMTFHGKERMDADTRSRIHESPRAMTVPLAALAVLSVVGGWIGIPHIFGGNNYFERWLEPVLSHPSFATEAHALASTSGNAGMEWTLMIATVVLVALAIYVAYRFYNKRPESATRLRKKLNGIHVLLLNKYYVDEIYGAVVVRPVVYGSLFLWKFVDVILIDGLVNGLSVLYNDLSEVVRYGQSGKVRTYATVFVGGVLLLIAWFVVGR